MTRWEYRHLEGQSRDLGSVVDALNFLGEDGWELVSCVNIAKPADGVACVLKRERPKAAAKTTEVAVRR